MGLPEFRSSYHIRISGRTLLVRWAAKVKLSRISLPIKIMFSSTPLSLASCITFGLLAGSLAGGYCGGRLILINDYIVIVAE